MARNMIFVIFFINAVCMLHFTEGTTFTPSTSNELQIALNQALNGDVIELFAIDYPGDFLLSASDPSAYIILRGAGASISGVNTALKITSGKWDIQTVTIASGTVGIDIEGSGSRVSALIIRNTTQAVIVEGNDNTLESLTITGGSSGVVVNGLRNVVVSCTIEEMSSYGIKVESGTQNVLESNSLTNLLPGAKGFSLEAFSYASLVNSTTATSLSEVKGNSNEFRGITVTGGVNIFGCQNAFYSCTMDRVYKTSLCDNDLTSSNTIGTTEDNPIV